VVLDSALYRTESRGAHARRGLPRARRRELAQAHARLARRGRPGAARRPPLPSQPALQRSPSLPASRAGVLIWPALPDG
jgi:hypothetical protein